MVPLTASVKLNGPTVQPILPLHSYEEYLDRLEQSQIRLEFIDGIVYAMAGSTPRHNKLCARLATQVGGQLTADCEAYSPDQRIRVQGASMFPISRSSAASSSSPQTIEMPSPQHLPGALALTRIPAAA